MPLIEINWEPPPRQLRQFGMLCLVALPTAGWLWGSSVPVLGCLIGVAMVVAVTGWLRPNWIRPLFVGAILLTAPIGMIVGELAMLILFFGLFLPIGILFRLMRRDALKLTMNRTHPTHWQVKKNPDKVSRYYRRY